MTQAQRVVARFGGAPKMAVTTVFPEQTIRNWLRSGTIPQKYWVTILLSRASAPDLSIWDFVGEIISEAGIESILPLAHQTSGDVPASSASRPASTPGE